MVMVVADAARLFSADVRIIQPTIAAMRHAIPPIKNAIGAPKSVVRPPARRFPSGMPPAYTSRYTLIALPRRELGVTVWMVVLAVAVITICANPTPASNGNERM